jgi:hypothetical protein
LRCGACGVVLAVCAGGAVWCGVMWCGTVWCLRCGALRCGACGVVLAVCAGGAVWCGTVWCGVGWNDVVCMWHCALQYPGMWWVRCGVLLVCMWWCAGRFGVLLCGCCETCEAHGVQ